VRADVGLELGAECIDVARATLARVAASRLHVGRILDPHPLRRHRGCIRRGYLRSLYVRGIFHDDVDRWLLYVCHALSQKALTVLDLDLICKLCTRPCAVCHIHVLSCEMSESTSYLAMG
jgi:hypothetical protein